MPAIPSPDSTETMDAVAWQIVLVACSNVSCTLLNSTYRLNPNSGISYYPVRITGLSSSRFSHVKFEMHTLRL